MKSSFGKNLKVTVFGGSHEDHIGVTITGLPANTAFDLDELQAFLKRRAPGNSPLTSPRQEADLIRIQEGASHFDSIVVTSDAPLTCIIKNTDRRSKDYENIRHIPRPGHADFTAYKKYEDKVNMTGGGPFSARMTAPLCIAGGIALQLLRKRGIQVSARIESIGGVRGTRAQMEQVILDAKAQEDSVGGIIEVRAEGCPPGLGGPMYDGLESVLAPVFFGIPAVKGVEFGAGFESSKMRGSAHNDPFIVESGQVKTTSNHHGGILGGISSGMPIVARLAFKPTPSIGKPQQSVDLRTLTPATLSIEGRHDPCVVPRAVPVTEAALAVGLLDILMEEE